MMDKCSFLRVLFLLFFASRKLLGGRGYIGVNERGPSWQVQASRYLELSTESIQISNAIPTIYSTGKCDINMTIKY